MKTMAEGWWGSRRQAEWR
ncbi:hypothetical protein A2U01_0090070, partial [Trifolium medium]|nr:hypothetical protein [Trifolium medium]